MEDTLLDETIEDITLSGHTPEDIIFIGSVQSGHRCTWQQFRELANFEYDSGYGAQKVAFDLIIVFCDGTSMTRGEYDGSEYWSYSKPFVEPEQTKAITSLFVKPEQVGWKTLEAINEGDNEHNDDDFE